MIKQASEIYAYLKRVCALVQADACIALLTEKAGKRLEHAVRRKNRQLDSYSATIANLSQPSAAQAAALSGRGGYISHTDAAPVAALDTVAYADLAAPVIPQKTREEQRTRKKKRKVSRKAREKSR